MIDHIILEAYKREVHLMKRIESFQQWLDEIQRNSKLLLFVETDNCSVCHGLLPQVEELQEIYDLPFYIVNAGQVPEMTGQLSLFSAPVVLLYSDEKEYARFARFVPIGELTYRIEELLDGSGTT